MFTNQARIAVFSIFAAMLVFFLFQRTYQLAAVTWMLMCLLVIDYVRQGTLIQAAKYFHTKDYNKAEELLLQIRWPEKLSPKKRGFYEFMMGAISVQKREYEDAERHYELAAQFPLRNWNDHVASLVHVANISIRLGKMDKAVAYLELAQKKEDKITSKMKEVISRLQQEINQHQNKNQAGD